MTLPPSTATSCLAFFLPIFGTSKSHTVPLVNCNRRDENSLPSLSSTVWSSSRGARALGVASDLGEHGALKAILAARVVP
jgi:hypothetical protein